MIRNDTTGEKSSLSIIITSKMEQVIIDHSHSDFLLAESQNVNRSNDHCSQGTIDLSLFGIFPNFVFDGDELISENIRYIKTNIKKKRNYDGIVLTLHRIDKIVRLKIYQNGKLWKRRLYSEKGDLLKEGEYDISGPEYKKIGIWKKWCYGKLDYGKLDYEKNYESGIHKRWWGNGNLREVKYKFTDQLSVLYYENGKIKSSGKYRNGKKTGEWNHWNCKGGVERKEHYENGKKEGVCESWYSNGQMEYHTNYKNGKEDGICKEWYENGTLWQEGVNKNGGGEGIWRFWGKNGNLEDQGRMEDDQRVGVWEYWDEEGNLTTKLEEPWVITTLNQELIDQNISIYGIVKN